MALDNKEIFFITVFNERFSDENFEIEDGKRKSETFFLCEETKSSLLIFKKSLYYYINNIREIPNQNVDSEVALKLSIKKQKGFGSWWPFSSDKNDEEQNYELSNINSLSYMVEFKQKQIKNDITFLFNYSFYYKKPGLNTETLKMQNFFDLASKLKHWLEEISISEKFLYYFEYLLKCKVDLDKEIKYYSSLINDFIVEKNNNNAKINIEIIICMLIASYYEKNFESIINLNLNKKIIDIKNIRDNYLIKQYSGIYLKQINKCLDKIKENGIENKNKNIILEIIIVYFIIFNKENIDILFSDNYKNLISDFFKNNEKTIILGDILDEDTTQIFIKNISGLDNIINVLKQSKNYIDYLEKINNNFETISKEIRSVKSIKDVFKKFRVEFEVSQLDNIEKFVEIHNSLFEKQKKINTFIIDFKKIFEQYFFLFNRYKNLSFICTLEKMVYDEIKTFPNAKILKDVEKKYIEKILSLLFDDDRKKLNDFSEADLIEILSKLKHHFSDGTFNLNQKEIILNYFIEKCKNNSRGLIYKYKENKIYELFISKKTDKEKFKKILENCEFNDDNNFLELFPDDKEYIDIQYKLINKILEHQNDDAKEQRDLSYIKFLEKNGDSLIKFVENY